MQNQLGYSNRNIGLKPSSLSDIADIHSLKNSQKIVECVPCEKDTISTDDYISNLMELTNLKTKQNVSVPPIEIPDMKSCDRGRTNQVISNYTYISSYSDIMLGKIVDDGLDWSD